MPIPSPTDNADGPVELTIRLDGQKLRSEAQILRCIVEKEIGRIPRAVLVLQITDALASAAPGLGRDAIALGTAITISAAYGSGEAQPLFEGVVMTSRLMINEASGICVELICRDKAMKLLAGRNWGQYLAQKDSEVMQAIIRDAGLSADIRTTDDAPRDQLQVAVSDWDFLRMLADRNGLVLTVDAGKIVAAAPDTAAEPVLGVSLGRDLLELDVRIDAQEATRAAEYRAWDAQQQEAVSGKSDRPPVQTLGRNSSIDIAKVLDARPWQVASAASLSQADLNVMSKARLMRLAMAMKRGRCRFNGSGAIAPGDMLEVGDTGDVYTGRIYVSGLRHDIRDGQWTTEARLGLDPDWATDRPAVPAPGAGGITAAHMGLQIGKVITVAEDPDGHQRIKVRLPMIADPGAEIWARYAQPYASGGAGVQFMPEVDDEVVIGFLSADPNAAIVLGSLHNAQAAQAITPEEGNHQKAIVTRGALRIDFDDDRKILTLSTPGGHSVTLDDEAGQLSLADMNGNSLTFSQSGIKMTSESDISVTASGKVEITASSGDVTVEGANVTCAGNLEFTGKGGSGAELSSGGTTKVEGSLVMIN